jgi:ABC-type dipeptide/oligopeptide/nickel transport system permease component
VISYIGRRVLLTLPVVLGVLFAVSLIVRLTPGDPAVVLLGQSANPQAITALRKELGLDQPILMQYLAYLGNALAGDLGRSYRSGQAVTAIIAASLPNTILLTVGGLIVSLAIGLPIGIFSALRSSSWLDRALTTLSLLGLSMPVFWTGIIMQWLLSYRLRWLPTSGMGGFSHLIMPALAIGSYTAANFIRMVRATMLDVMREDFVRTALAKGLGPWTVLHHIVANAMLPIVTTIGLQVGLLLGGSILTETIFAWPGIGLQMIQAINARDIVLIQGLVLVTSLLFVLTNLLVDISYVALDPRVKPA